MAAALTTQHHTATSMASLRPPRWYRSPRPIDLDALRPDESVVEVTCLTVEGNQTTFPALVSPHYPRSYIPVQTVNCLGHATQDLRPGEAGTFFTPARGRVRSTRDVGLSVIINHVFEPVIVRPLVMEARYGDLGVDMILGRPFIEELWGPGGWLLQQYVLPGVQVMDERDLNQGAGMIPGPHSIDDAWGAGGLPAQQYVPQDIIHGDDTMFSIPPGLDSIEYPGAPGGRRPQQYVAWDAIQADENTMATPLVDDHTVVDLGDQGMTGVGLNLGTGGGYLFQQ